MLHNIKTIVTELRAVISAFGREFAKTGVVPIEFHRYLFRGMEVRHT